MYATRVTLADGSVLSSGSGSINALQSLLFTETVNDSVDLNLGSTCASSVDITFINPQGNLHIEAGEEIKVERLNELGEVTSLGFFKLEKPTRPSANTLKVTAFDRVSWLDKDLTTWLASLGQWPYRLIDFAHLVCNSCGLQLVNQDIPNGDYLVQRFAASGITGRQLMQWVGQIAGRFCRATPDGDIELAWYQPLLDIQIGVCPSLVDGLFYDRSGTVTILDPEASVVEVNGSVAIDSPNIELLESTNKSVSIDVTAGVKVRQYFQNGLTYQDYKVAPIEKVQLKGSDTDVGTVYPEDLMESVNTYMITGNYLLTAQRSSDLASIAQNLYEQLKSVSYTPCKISIPVTHNIRAGHIVRVVDKNGVQLDAYVMKSSVAGQKQTLECTGNARRDSTAVVNTQKYQALVGQVLDLQLGVEGLRLENKNTVGQLSSLSLNVGEISTEVKNQSTMVGQVQEQVTKITQRTDGLELSIQNINDNGVSKVETSTGFTFKEDGLRISRSDSDIDNQINETGMYVRRNQEVLLQANDDGVLAVDVTVRNYLVVGTHARFENYSDGRDSKRTACFWL